MSTDLKIDMNAVGYGSQDLRSEDGGNNSRGMLDQVRATGIMATGEAGRGLQARGEKGRQTSGRGKRRGRK